MVFNARSLCIYITVIITKYSEYYTSFQIISQPRPPAIVVGVVDDTEAALGLDAPSQAIEDVAVLEGMITMKQDGFLKVREGITTVEEVLRVAEE